MLLRSRRDLKGRGPYLPDQAFTVQEAIDSFEEDIQGQIIPGGIAAFFSMIPHRAGKGNSNVRYPQKTSSPSAPQATLPIDFLVFLC